MTTEVFPLAAAVDAAGPVLATIVTRGPLSRAGLGEAIALSRATLGQRVAALIGAGLLRESAAMESSGGRPARRLSLVPEAAVTLAIDMGERHVRIAVTDLAPAILAQETQPFRIEDGPEAALERIAEGVEALYRRHGHGRTIAGVGISMPAPVDHRIGRIFGPSILIGWDDFPVGDWLARRFGAPAIVENDVNVMTVFARRGMTGTVDDLLFVKVGTGIGSGIISGGRLHRGAQGAAGDIGHMQIVADPAPLCRCGKLGCLEARAAGWALARDLRALGHDAWDARDVVALVDRQVPEAIQIVRASGRALGAAISDAIAIINPGRIAIGGTMARAYDHLLSGIRETIAQRCLPLATRDLVIERAVLPDEACLIGAAHCVMERAFAAEGVDGFLERYRPRRDRTAAG